MTAIRVAEAGQPVTLFDRRPTIMGAASFGANRLHMGFHYPRDDETVRQCQRGYERFRREFEAAIVKGVSNAYFIASEGSLTSSKDFLKFCDRLRLPFRQIDPDAFLPAVENVDLGVITEEVLYDAAILRPLMGDRLDRLGVETRLGCEVTDIWRQADGGFVLSTSDSAKPRFDAVVNCSYADVNRLTAKLGHSVARRQYEYVAAAIIEFPRSELTSITVLDGPFLSLLPFGGRGQYLLLHTHHSVIAREDASLVNPAWLVPHSSPFASLNKAQWFETLLESSRHFIPSVHNARLTGFQHGPRMVLSNAEDTDARPSHVTLHEPGYIAVFAGKVGHCMWVGDEVADKLGCAAYGQA
jgi:glycine/D-amino acid oxidase-like deaminating enzyme